MSLMRNLLGSAALALTLMLTPAAAGGTLVITYKDDVSTLDPAIAYDWQNWSMVKSLFARLMDYEPGTTTLRTGLAESYGISPDGKTYTFVLRPAKFHNGRAITAADVKYSIERAINPATQGPGGGFFAAIEGHADLAAGKTDTLPGITAVDDRTVRFTLSRPDATFLHAMAINFASVVPREEVERLGQDFGRSPVGSGAFRFVEWQPGQQVLLERNPDFYEPGVPKLDAVRVELGQEPVVALLRLQQGEVDLLGDQIPPAKFVEVMASEEFKGRITKGEQLHTGYVTLNVKMEPFDDVRVRRAVNMAINKDRIVQLINGRATPANQPLPPLMPGYAKDYAGIPYDPAAAKALLAEAGLPDGFETELYTLNTDPQPRIAQAIQQDLAEIGVKVSLKSLAQANVIEAGGTEGGAPMVWSGGLGWIADFPDPSNFYGPILGCGGAVTGGWNWSWYCNPEADRMAVEADSMADPAKAAERAALWSKIYTTIQEEAPWIPVFHENRFVLRSPRVQGSDALLVDPVHLVNYNHLDVAE